MAVVATTHKEEKPIRLSDKAPMLAKLIRSSGLTCPRCEAAVGSVETCTRCKGSGRRALRCPDCDGSGREKPWGYFVNKCETCNGTGTDAGEVEG